MVEELVQLAGIAIEAESAFLALWIQRCQQAQQPAEK